MLLNFNDLYKLLENTQDVIGESAAKGLKNAGERVAKDSKAKLGTYQPASGPYPGWPSLKPETAQRKHLSKSAAPLVGTGQLKQAITADVGNAVSGVVYVGVAGGKGGNRRAPGEYAAAHEFGCAKSGIPPRPYLRPAAYENREEIRNDVAEALKEGLGSLW